MWNEMGSFCCWFKVSEKQIWSDLTYKIWDFAHKLGKTAVDGDAHIGAAFFIYWKRKACEQSPRVLLLKMMFPPFWWMAEMLILWNVVMSPFGKFYESLSWGIWEYKRTGVYLYTSWIYFPFLLVCALSTLSRLTKAFHDPLFLT